MITRRGIMAAQFSLESLDAIVLDFDGVLTDNKVYVGQDGKELVKCDRGDGLAFDALRKLSINVYIISTEQNSVVKARADKLKINCIHGVRDKTVALDKLCLDNGYEKSRILFIGNDLNDYLAMKACGYSACPADSHELIKKEATLVLSGFGGDGVMRELLEDWLDLDLISILYKN